LFNLLYNNIKSILPKFQFKGRFASAEELHSGNINSTYHLTYRDGDQVNHYTLQMINAYVFKDPASVMRNIELVTDHLRNSIVGEGHSPQRRVLDLIPMVNGETLHIDRIGNYWRAYHYINEATAYDAVKKPEHFYEAGRAFGEFQKRLFNFPAETLTETIPNFHNTPKRFFTFVHAVDQDLAGRVGEIEDEIEFFFERRKMMGEIAKRLSNGTLPVRVTHNDTKINNVMIDDKTDKSICVIDLDTVMPGSSLYDFGDAIRFGASTAAEDEPDLNKITLDFDLYELFTKGFLSETNGFLERSELELLPLGVKVITCELAMRFLTDYIDGDLYFKVTGPDHNLTRARAQMKLLTELEKNEEKMQAVILKLM